MDLHVLTVSDDRYTPYMGTSLLSLLENNAQHFDKVYLHIVDNGISEERRRKLLQQSAKYQNVITVFQDLGECLSQIHPVVENGWDVSIYGRFFADVIVDEDVERVLYLDSDTIVNSSLKELMSIDLEGYCLAGVRDVSEASQKKELEMDDDAYYINSGMLVINIKKWRELRIREKLVEFMNTYPRKLMAPDQDAINVVCAHMVRILPAKYNFGWMINERSLQYEYQGVFPYSNEELLSIIQNSYAGVAIFHYFGSLKPWRKGECIGGFESVFLSYYKRSIWRERRRFISTQKMFRYYFLENPMHRFCNLAKRLMGAERYNRYYEMATNWRGSAKLERNGETC